MSVINTNVMSLNAQRNLSSNSASLSTSIQRLSSGLRINSAKDDAAGIAISERFTTQIRGMNQAARNANDGISLAQTAEGSMGEIANNLQRIRELAVQSANATNSDSDRQALQSEVSQLVNEIDRVASQTEFNGLKLLDGTFSSQAFQVGANAGQTINISSIASARTATLGSGFTASATGTAVTAALQTGDLTVNGRAVDASTAGTGGPTNGLGADSANRIAAAINAAQSGVQATANTTVAAAGTTAAGSAGTMGASAGGTLNVNGVAMSFAPGAFADANTADQNRDVIRNRINQDSAATGVTAVNSGSGIELRAADGRNINLSVDGGATGNFSLANMGLANTATTRGTVSLTSTNGESITLGGANETRAGFTDGQVIARVASGTAIANLNISSVSGANTAIQSVDAALKTISSSRADLGAVQNRFQSVISNLNTTAENLSASRSRIRDTDYAKETAELSRTQILSQAGTAMLAQANQATQSVLSLLR